MATQGMITLTRDNEVRMKIIAGCNGGFVIDTLNQIMEAIDDKTRLPAIYAIALAAKLGCKKCLVILTKTGIYHELDEPISDLYRETFEKRRFNPRWDNGRIGMYIEMEV